MRRKGIPGSCCGDTCGNKLRKINGISPDPNGEFNISAGAGVGITEDENGIIIDASAASGVLTINGEAPDADGNFDGVVTVGDAQDITGLKTFKTPIGPFIKVSHPYPGGATDYADIDQYVNNILSNRIRMQRDGTTNANSIQLMPRNVTGGTGGLPLSVNYDPATNKMYAMAPVRTYNTVNVNDIVTIGMMKDNAVTIVDAQTITAEKIFKQPIRLLSDNSDPIIEITSNYPRIVGHNPNNLNSADGMFFQQIGYDASQINRYQMDGFRRGSASQTELHTYIRNNSNQLVDNGLFITDSNIAWMTAPYRAYASANVNDVVTIGSLATNPNVVHTTGNENVNGTKTFTNEIKRKGGYDGNDNFKLIVQDDNNNVNQSFLYVKKLSDGKRSLNIALLNSDDSTYSYIEIARSS